MSQPKEQSQEIKEKSLKRSAEDAGLSKNGEDYHPSKKKRVNRQPCDGKFIKFENFPQPLIDDLLNQISDMAEKEDELKGSKATIIPIERIRVLPSEKERKEERKRYRETYNKSPKYIEKKKIKATDPTEKEKRKKYNDDIKVKERKKECARGRRKALVDLKELFPDVYATVIKKHVQTIPRAPKKSKGIVK